MNEANVFTVLRIQELNSELQVSLHHPKHQIVADLDTRQRGNTKNMKFVAMVVGLFRFFRSQEGRLPVPLAQPRIFYYRQVVLV